MASPECAYRKAVAIVLSSHDYICTACRCQMRQLQMHAAKNQAKTRRIERSQEAGRNGQDFSLVSTVVDEVILRPVILRLTPEDKS
jgi:hypothetical protein